MRRGLLVVLLAGITAAAWFAVGSQAGTKHSSSGSSVTIANVAGMSWTCGFNPFNSTVQFLSFGPYLCSTLPLDPTSRCPCASLPFTSIRLGRTSTR